MYAWMARWLQGQPPGPVEEKPFTVPPRDRLKVFLDDEYPPDAISESEYNAAWIQQRRRDLEKLESWDVAYASEKLRIARYAYSDQEVKQYLPESSVLPGMFRLIETLYGL